MNENYMSILKNEVIINLQKHSCNNDCISHISSMFDTVSNQFNSIRSEHRRFNKLEKWAF